MKYHFSFLLLFALVLTLVNVQAVDNSSGSTVSSDIPWERPEVDPPSGLRGLEGNDCVFLDWNPNLEEEIMGYWVFKRKKGYEGFKEVGNKLYRHAYCKLEDQDNGESFEYALKAFLKNGVVSDFSNVVTVIPEKTKSPEVDE